MSYLQVVINIKGFIMQHFIMSVRWVVPVHSPCPQSIIYTFWFWKGKFPEHWLFVFVTQITSRKEMRRQLQCSLSLLSTAVGSCKSKQVISRFFCWESLNNRWVLGSIPMNIMELQGQLSCNYRISYMFSNRVLFLLFMPFFYRLYHIIAKWF